MLQGTLPMFRAQLSHFKDMSLREIVTHPRLHMLLYNQAQNPTNPYFITSQYLIKIHIFPQMIFMRYGKVCSFLADSET